MKKKTGNILLLLLLLSASPALCQDFITAKIVAVDPGKLELTIVTPTNPDNQITVRIAKKNDLPQAARGTFFPGCVTPGATIRLWGSSSKQADDPFFVATDIRGCKSGGCSDPTGVRSRLRTIQEHERKSWEESPDNRSHGNHGQSGHGNGGGGGNGGNGSGGGGGGGR